MSDNKITTNFKSNSTNHWYDPFHPSPTPPDPYGPGYGPFTPSVPVTSPLCATHHEIEAITQYDDGAFGNCKNCGLRVKVPTVPCGINGILVKDLLAEVITKSRDDSELLSALGELVALMDVEKEELALAESRLQLISDILAERSGLVD